MRILRKLFLMIFMATYLVNGQNIDKNNTYKIKLNSDDSNDTRTFSVAGGIGINLVYAPDLASFFTYLSTTGEKIGPINPTFEFFAAAGYKFLPQWNVKIEYAYLFNSINISNSEYVSYENFYSVRMYTLIFEKTLGAVDSPLKIGAGIGYRSAFLEYKFVGEFDESYYSSGVGVKAKADLNTPFGDNLFGYISGDVGLNFMTDFKDNNGQKLIYHPDVHTEKKVNMNFYSIGLKFGLIYYI